VPTIYTSRLTLPLLPHSEETIILLMKERNERAFSHLYDVFAPALYGFITARVTDEKQAIAVHRHTFAFVWKHIGEYDSSKQRLLAWMISIAMRECRSTTMVEV
jgi:DNA-directed RNA polymerase specialized sigma24 family protein